MELVMTSTVQLSDGRSNKSAQRLTEDRTESLAS